ncbi:death domain-associated protein 6 isoform X1 [Oncorhynchus keta]|uniref:death domain-associated protein 6 isoform X1 n=1 Tax=Oncorhynchus keta TaxID=8018 RepID=UPI00227CFAFB|nr:death domain-associated protein 6 isoform X1 [Oncorhynchus keta]
MAHLADVALKHHFFFSAKIKTRRYTGRTQSQAKNSPYLMAVASAAVMDSIVILDDDEEEERPQPSSSTSSKPSANHRTPPKIQQPAPTHITQSPFATVKKESHVLKAENQKLFTEFVEYCSAHTQDCPEVMTFLHAKHSKASPNFLASVEFRNTLGRCLTRAQARRTKTFVYINELCTVLKQHSDKRRQTVVKVEPTAGEKKEMKEEAPTEELPSTSGQQEEKNDEEEEEEERKTKKASRRQIAYLENLLKMYNDEIRRLQEKELSVNELEEEDSSYIQEHKLKRKMMKIYDKLCELKGCSSLTGRVIEQRIQYKGTRYPEVNRKIERFINGPEAQLNPPDYTDILQHIRRANERHGLNLSKKQLTQIAQDAFRETGNRLQERRHLDMVYNFGSHLTDLYKPATDPALLDPTLARKLRTNREVALSSLEQVISKYALKQDDTEQEERAKRIERERQKKEGQSSALEATTADDNPLKKGEEGEEQVEEEEDDDEDDESSDPDIEEEIQASKSQAGPEDDEEEDNEVEAANESENGVDGGSDRDQDGGEDEGNAEVDKDSVMSGISLISRVDTPRISSLVDESPTDSPSQSEAMEVDKGNESSNTNLTKEDIVSSNHVSAVSISTGVETKDSSASPMAANQVSLPPSPVLISTNEDSCTVITETRSANCSPRPPSPKDTCRGKKRKRKEEVKSRKSYNGVLRHHNGSGRDLPLDMDVVTSSPLQADSTRADSPTQEMVTSSQSTPPPKKNKVNVATQCDPDEVIILSDSE